MTGAGCHIGIKKAVGGAPGAAECRQENSDDGIQTMTLAKPARGRRIRCGVAVACVTFAMAWSPVTTADEPQHDLLFFLSVEQFENLDDPVPTIDDSYTLPAVDVLYVYNNDRFRLLGEYILSTEESELERLQFGWRASPATMVWLGRFHAISKYWTTEYHHGQFMQTSISRPGLEAWEDESGAMPSHVTGLLVEHDIERGSGRFIDFDVAVGIGPVFEKDELKPFDVFGETGGDLAFNARVVVRPDAVSDNQVGVAVGWTDIPVMSESSPELADLDHVDQLSIGLFADWRWDDWRAIGSSVYFRNDLRYTDSDIRDEYVASYVQLEYQAATDWTVFGRTEFGTSEDRSPFLRLLPAFIAHRHMLGVRWDFRNQQSLTFEVADTSTQGEDFEHDSFKEVRLQWSAFLP